MPSFVVHDTWTQQGMRDIRNSPIRLDEVRAMARSIGTKIEHFFLVSGNYNLLVIASAPDNSSAVKLTLAVEAGGHVRTSLPQAFTETEYRYIVASLP